MKQTARRKVTTALGVAGLLAFLVVRKVHSLRGVDNPALKKATTENNDQIAQPDTSREPPHTERRIIYWLKLFSITAATISFIVTFRFGYLVAAGALLLVAAFLSTLFFRMPPRPKEPILSIPLFLLAIIQVFAVVIAAGNGLSSAASPSRLIISITFGLVGAFLAAIIIAKLMKPSRFAEPVSAGVAALAIVLICLPGLIVFTEPLTYPTDSGSVLLFIGGPPNRPLTLDVTVDPVAIPAFETFEITSNTSREKIPWVLVLSGAARMTHITDLTTRSEVHNIKLPTYSSGYYAIPGGQVQLLSGSASFGLEPLITGRAIGSFANFTSDQIGVTLPFYEIDSSLEVSPMLEAAIGKLLGTKAGMILPRHSTLNVFAEGTGLETVTSSIPTPMPESSKYGDLEWSSQNGSPITYSTSDQDLSGLISDALFFVAFLLGIAGAALLVCLQSAIHLYLSGKTQEP